MPRPDELPPDRATWVSKWTENERPVGRNEGLKKLIKTKVNYMKSLESYNQKRMQLLAQEIKELRMKLKEFENTPGVQ